MEVFRAGLEIRVSIEWFSDGEVVVFLLPVSEGPDGRKRKELPLSGLLAYSEASEWLAVSVLAIVDRVAPKV